MDVTQLRSLLSELLQAIEMVMQSGEELPDELQGEIAKTIELLYNKIEQLSGEAPTNIPELSSAPHASSQINSFKYNPKTEDLFVKYQDKYPGTNGPVYKYTGVPQFIYNIFSRGAVPPKTSGRNAWHEWKKNVTPSLGAAANALIKAGGYNYTRMS